MGQLKTEKMAEEAEQARIGRYISEKNGWECGNCAATIEGCEHEVFHRTGYCAQCANTFDKIMRED
jgi:hypothetical protein